MSADPVLVFRAALAEVGERQPADVWVEGRCLHWSFTGADALNHRRAALLAWMAMGESSRITCCDACWTAAGGDSRWGLSLCSGFTLAEVLRGARCG